MLDINRLLFIEDGQKCLSQVTNPNLEAIHTELNRILNQRNGLLQTMEDLDQEKETINQELTVWYQKQNEIYDLIHRKLQLEVNQFTSDLEGYRDGLEARGRQQMIRIFRNLTQTYGEQDEPLYCPHKYFSSAFCAAICRYVKNILQLSPSTPLVFRIDDFSLTSSYPYQTAAVLVALRSYLANMAAINPGLLMLDLSSCLETDKEWANIYQYLQKHSDEGQVIITAPSTGICITT